MGIDSNVMRSRAERLGPGRAALTIQALVFACSRQGVVTLPSDHLAQGRFLLS